MHCSYHSVVQCSSLKGKPFPWACLPSWPWTPFPECHVGHIWLRPWIGVVLCLQFSDRQTDVSAALNNQLSFCSHWDMILSFLRWYCWLGVKTLCTKSIFKHKNDMMNFTWLAHIKVELVSGEIMTACTQSAKFQAPTKRDEVHLEFSRSCPSPDTHR